MSFSIFLWFVWCLVSSNARRSDVCEQNKAGAGQVEEGSDSIAAIGQSEETFNATDEGNHSMHNDSISAPKPAGVCEEPLFVEDFYDIESKSFAGGTFGLVYKGKSKRSKYPVAIKDISKLDEFNPEELEPSRHKIPYVSSLVEAFYRKENGHVAIIYPLYEGGDLHTWMETHPSRPSDRIHDMISQIVYGVWRLHVAGFIHRDLKPQNILTEFIAVSGGHIRRQVLTDFGLAQPGCSRRNPLCGHGRIGTPSHMGPGQFNSPRYGLSEDWFSVGVILYQLTTNRLPFQQFGMEIHQIAHAVANMQPDLSMITDAELSDLLFKLLSPTYNEDPQAYFAETPGLHPVLGHPYFYKFTRAPAGGGAGQPQRAGRQYLNTEGLPVGWLLFQDLSSGQQIFESAVNGAQQGSRPQPFQSSQIIVTGGLDDAMSVILRGIYLFQKFNGFSRPTYGKDSHVNVGGVQMHPQIFYGKTPSHEGWWFGSPEHNVIWAFNGLREQFVPATGWTVPFDKGFLDRSFQITFAVQQSTPSAPATLYISGGSNAEITGTYTISSYQILGRPFYKKTERVMKDGVQKYVRLYYFEDPSRSGWFFGADVGGPQVLGYAREGGPVPPSTGWSIDGRPDPTFQIQGPKQRFWHQLCLKYHPGEEGSESCDLRNSGRGDPLPLCRRAAVKTAEESRRFWWY